MRITRNNPRFLLAARHSVQAPSALTPLRRFKIQNSKFKINIYTSSHICARSEGCNGD